jgi:hypothetical protein
LIKIESYGKEWINSHRSREGFERINPPLAEKMFHSLGLVELLALEGLDFIFKGGTSLILLLDSPGRFSIDIDIITRSERNVIEETLAKICNGKPFTNFKLQERRSYKEGIPKAHYALLYNSTLTGKEDNILLDILYDDHPYPSVLKKPILTEWLLTDDNPVLVQVPSHESITGDKLTAFAPGTTGILYKTGKELEIIKQLFDLGRLYHEIEEIATVGQAFSKTAQKEIEYRGKQFSMNDVITDIMETALLIANREKNKNEPDLSNFKELRFGLLQFKAYQTNSFFRIEEAITAAAKAALLAASIRAGKKGAVNIYDPSIKKTDYLIRDAKYNFLNRLQPEPLYYWHKTIQLLSEQ